MVVEFGQRILEHIIGVHLLICSYFIHRIARVAFQESLDKLYISLVHEKRWLCLHWHPHARRERQGHSGSLLLETPQWQERICQGTLPETVTDVWLVHF